jgi:hypothetical protein
MLGIRRELAGPGQHPSKMVKPLFHTMGDRAISSAEIAVKFTLEEVVAAKLARSIIAATADGSLERR